MRYFTVKCRFVFFLLNNVLNKKENSHAGLVRNILVHGHFVTQWHTIHAAPHINSNARKASARFYISETRAHNESSFVHFYSNSMFGHAIDN